uniref:Uncharacterized protein n=1 Tax=Arthroderma benhamiae TaxID=63400 RepID=E2DHI0_ARTBE|nr:hypothetical protein [Trichophyton benhamiae]
MRGRGGRKGGRYKRDTRRNLRPPEFSRHAVTDVTSASFSFLSRGQSLCLLSQSGNGGAGGRLFREAGGRGKEGEREGRRCGGWERSSWKDRGDSEGRRSFWAGRSTGLELKRRRRRKMMYFTRCCGSAKAAMAAIGEQELAMETGSRTRLVHAGAASTLFRLQSLEG